MFRLINSNNITDKLLIGYNVYHFFVKDMVVQSIGVFCVELQTHAKKRDRSHRYRDSSDTLSGYRGHGNHI